MALPKEPRQKMINFMYLVLTAMLALNVSAEILNAFKVVDASLIKSNGIVDQSSKGIQTGLQELLKDPGNAQNAAIWKPKADSALAITSQVSAYIDNLKGELKAAAGYKAAEGDQSFKDDDLDAPTRLFDTEKKGEELKAALVKFKTDVLAVLPEKQRNEIAAGIPIDVNTKEGQTFAVSYFHMTPAVAALTILSKFQSDVKRSGNMVATKCLEQVGKVVFHLDKFQAFAGQSSAYLLPGQPLEITAGLGAFSSENKPTVTINGASQALDGNGVATYKTTAEGAGEHSVNVVISYVNPNTNKAEVTEKKITYTVGVASGASIFLEKMNVMYIGVDNPITVSAGSIKRENMNVSLGGGGTLTPSGGDKYIAKVTTQGPTTLTISGDGKSFSFPIRVKELPAPTGLVNNMTGGTIPTNTFKGFGAVLAKLQNSDFEANYTVVSYKLGANCGGSYNEVQITGPRYEGNAITNSLKPGCLVWISDLMVRWPSGTVKKIPEMAFRLQ